VDEVGVDPLELHWRDGSGLSAYNLLSPRALIRILDDARTRPWFELYRMAQAEPGREDSTLRNRLLPLAGRLYAKTGSISHVNALSGIPRARRRLGGHLLCPHEHREPPAAQVRRPWTSSSWRSAAPDPRETDVSNA
jgi:hypothetical protein